MLIKRKSQAVRLAVLMLFISALCPHKSFGQLNPERATRESNILSDKEERLKRSLTVPSKEAKPPMPAPQAPPAEQPQVKFFVQKIMLEGTKSFPPESFDNILKEYEGREVSITDLYALARKIEEEYLHRGVIAAVFLPPQKVGEATVTLSVVEAKMGKLQIQDAPFFKKKRLEEYWKIRQGDVLKYDELSEGLQLMNKNPDRAVRATLKAGEIPETTDVILAQETNFPIHFFNTYDNDGVVSTGKSRTGLGIRDNNLLGFDDTLLCGYIFGRDFNGKYVFHNLPVGFRGASLLYGYSFNRSRPSKEFLAEGIHSRSGDASFSAHQDLFRSGNYFGEVFLGFLASDRTVSTNTGVFSHDCLRIFNAGSTFYWNTPESSTVVSPQVFQGVNGLGSTSNNNPLASRGAKVNFTKGDVDILHRRYLPAGLQATARLRAQICSTKLTPQQQFVLGGLDSVRGYPAGDYLADNAALLNVDLLIPLFFLPESLRLPYSRESLKRSVNFLTFLDYGWGMHRGKAEVEKKSMSLTGIGAGMDILLYDQIHLQTTWGFAVGDHPVTEGGSSQFRISINFQEDIPRYLKRMAKK